jgi:predicted RND superfamily exporter protein
MASAERSTDARPRALTRGPAWVALGVALVALALLARHGSTWPVDNRVGSWADAAGADPAHELLVERFGGDAAVLVRVSGLSVASDARAADDAVEAFLLGLRARFSALPAVRAVFDPLALPSTGRGPLRERLERALVSPLVRALDGVDATRVDYLVLVEPDARSEDQAGLAAGIDVLRSEAVGLGLELRAAGHPLIAAGLDAASRRVDLVFGPLLVVLALVACAFFLRSVPLALATMLPSIIASSGLRSCLMALGIDANMILVASAPLTFVVLVASTLHLTLRFLRLVEHGLAPLDAAVRARSETLGAALFAAVTTAVGFAVFGVSDIRAVRHLGLAVGAAVACAVPIVYWLLPLVLPAALGSAGAASRRTAALAAEDRRDDKGRRWRCLAAAAARRRGAVVVIAVLGCVAGALAPRGMHVSTDALDYFPTGHAVREEFLALEREGASLSTVDVLYSRPPDGRFDDEWSAVLQQRCGMLAGVLGTFGPVDVSADLMASLGAGPREALHASLVHEAAQRAAGRVDAAGEYARLTVRAQSSDLASIEALAARLSTLVEELRHEPGAAEDVLVTSSLTRLATLHEALVGTLATSLALTGGVALLAFLLALRGARERLAAIIANVLPVALVLVAARWLGFALDAATVMVASVVMGIAVDTTFHLLLTAQGRWTTEFARRRAILRAFARVGDAALASAVVLVAGFGALACADFVPTARFGLASAIGVAVALVADLIVVPAIVLARRRV